MTATALPDAATGPDAGTGLVVLARAGWPEPGDDAPPPVPGFVHSSFSPLVAEVARRCLERAGHAGGRTAIVLASTRGDVASARYVASAVDAGTRVGPLLFFQSVPNAVAGHVAARAGLTGPVVCLSPDTAPPGDASPDQAPPGALDHLLPAALAEAELLIADGDADDALVVAVEQAGHDHPTDRATALLVAPAARGGQP